MIKKGLFILSILSILVSCTEEQVNNYVTLSGKVDNATNKEIKISARNGYSKTIKIAEDGSFSDTLKIADKGEMFLFSIDQTSQIFLKNGDVITVTLDSKEVLKTLKFSGKGSETSNYIAKKNLLQSKVGINKLFDLPEEEFTSKSKEITDKFNKLMSDNKHIDSAFYVAEKDALGGLGAMLAKEYDRVNKSKTKLSSVEGKPSPDFNDYENYKGGKTSLKDLRGKYVYIDVWATWCGPCKKEIPFLQNLEKEFNGKNIHFLSISVDKESAKDKWKKMIADKNMSGIQLFATEGDSFAKDFKINSIPRFILLDPKGIVLKANMTRPSNPSTKDYLKNLIK